MIPWLLAKVSSINPARRVAYLRDRPYEPYEPCGLTLVVSFLRIDSLRIMSAQDTWGAWFDSVTGILLFRVLLGFGSTWDGHDLELIVGDPNIDGPSITPTGIVRNQTLLNDCVSGFYLP